GEAIRLDPNLGPIFADRYDEAIRLDPKNSATYGSRAATWGNKGDFDKAIADFDEAIRLDPKNWEAYIGRGHAWFAESEFDKALADYDEAIRLNPKNWEAYAGRGNAWWFKSEFDKALADYEEAIRLNPDNSVAYIGRGSALNSKGEYEKALADFDEAIRLDSESSSALNNRALLRATCPDAKFRDGAKAIEDATKGCELTDWKDPYCLDSLAAAYAEAGQFDKAVEWQEKAVELAPDDDDFETRLKLYQEGKPYREEPKK
ncbi:MAG TPA: tetratricopeptide repeat protein, partial [Pirellulales bacterium]|nr:tetratricopeptide repeat protein [Pirellulales bacterium]